MSIRKNLIYQVPNILQQVVVPLVGQITAIAKQAILVNIL